MTRLTNDSPALDTVRRMGFFTKPQPDPAVAAGVGNGLHRLRLSPGLGQRLVASLHVAPDMCRPTMAPALAPLPLRRARTTATFLGGWALGGGFPALLHSTHHLPATPV